MLLLAHLATHFRVREGTDGSKAYNNAVEKVQNHNRHARLFKIAVSKSSSDSISAALCDIQFQP